MKIAVCSTGSALDSPSDPRFGRCACFAIVDTETFDVFIVENPGVMSAQGAGIQAAQVVSSLGVSAVIGGSFGPNAHQVLSAAEIKTYACVGETVRYAVDLFNAGALSEISVPSVAARFGVNPVVPAQNLGQGRGMGMGGGMGRGGGRGRGRGRR